MRIYNIIRECFYILVFINREFFPVKLRYLRKNILSHIRCKKSLKVYFKVTISCGGKAAHERITENRTKRWQKEIQFLPKRNG